MNIRGPLQKKGYYLILFLCITLVLILCTFSGCINLTQATPPTDQHPVQSSGMDVIIPVDSASDMVSSNVMTKKNGVPGGSLIYEGLLTKNRTGVYEPSLAESWEVTEDAKTWTFHLVRNARWHDGVPVTSDDVKFTNDFLKANNLTMGFVLSDVVSVTCPDEYTAVFQLKNSYSVWPDRLAQSPGIGVYPRHVFEKVPDPKTWLDSQFIGTGPFRFDKSEPGYVRLARNDLYRGEKPRVTGVILKLVTNKDSQVLALKNKEVDAVSGISPAVAENLRNEPGIGIFTIPGTTGYELGFNMVRYPTNLSLFRRAMSHTVDRLTICNVLGNAHPTETTFLLPGVAGDYVNSGKTGMYDYNLSLARDLLREAGFIRDKQGTLRGPDGDPVELTLPIGGKGSIPDVEKIITVLRNNWAELGIKVKTEKYDEESQYRKAVTGKSHVFIDGMPSILHDDPDDLVNFAVTPLQQSNYYNFNDTEFNSLTVEVRNTIDKGERKRIGNRMQEILANNIPTVPICNTDNFIAYRKDRFTGWEASLHSTHTTLQDPRVLSALRPVAGPT